MKIDITGLNQIKKSPFYKNENGQIYYDGRYDNGKFHLVKSAINESFKPISNSFACDGQSIFCCSKIIAKGYTKFEKYSWNYLRVDDKLFFGNKLVNIKLKNSLINISDNFFRTDKELIINGIANKFDFLGSI
jgi:L-cysteine desulfidase